MKKKLRGRYVFSSEFVELSISDGIIEQVRPLSGEKAAEPWLSPGFFDIQVNGFRGIDYSSKELSGRDLAEIIRLLRSSGTTKHLPTIITSPPERIIKNLKTMAAVLEQMPGLQESVPGFHIEGPYISEEEGPRGAHDAEFIRDPDFEEFLEWQKASGGRIRIVTLAPERRGALDFIKKITESGVIAAIGHTAASAGTISDAVRAGARLSTHLGNGNHSLLPRLNNNLWQQLAEDELSASIISDGEHLPASLITTISRTKGNDKMILVSDASPFGGLAPGEYSWDNIAVEVGAAGRIGLSGTPFLAGAGHLLDFDLAHYIKSTGCTVPEAVKFCTVNPCRLLALPQNFYSIKEKTRADLIMLRYYDETAQMEIEHIN